MEIDNSGRIVRSLLIVALLFVSSSIASAQQPSQEMIARMKRAVVIVTSYDERAKPVVQGSGFFIAPDRIVTNLHVIKHASLIRIRTFAGKTITVQTVVATDASSDLALLQMNAPCTDTTLQVEDTTPVEGESIIVVSNPQASHWKITRGQLGPIWEFEGTGRRMQITASILPGSSGGPVLNQQGHVIGIAAMHTGSADDLNFAVPAESLKALQASAGVASNRAVTLANQPGQQ